jgi:hypothetical protein
MLRAQAFSEEETGQLHRAPEPERRGPCWVCIGSLVYRMRLAQHPKLGRT